MFTHACSRTFSRDFLLATVHYLEAHGKFACILLSATLVERHINLRAPFEQEAIWRR